MTKLWKLQFHNAHCRWINSLVQWFTNLPCVFFNFTLFLFFKYIFLIWKAWMAPMEGHKRTPCCLISSSLGGILKTLLLLWSLLNVNQSHFLQQVQMATRFNQIMISIAIILLCNFFVLLDCPFMLLLWLIFQIFVLLQRRRNQNYSHLKNIKKLWQIMWKCQNVWVAQFPWAKMLKNETRKVHHVKCLVCSWGMLVGECANMNMNKWAWIGEHDWIFFGIFCWCQKKNLTHGKKNIDVEEFFAICTWMNDIYGLKIQVDEKIDEQ